EKDSRDSSKRREFADAERHCPHPSRRAWGGSRAEVVGGPDAHSVDPALDHVLRGVAALEDVVELDLHVRVEEPVQPGGKVVEAAPLDGLVVQVEVAEAGADLPGAEAPGGVILLQVVAVQRHDTAEDSLAADVFLVLAGQEVEGLDIATVVENGALR